MKLNKMISVIDTHTAGEAARLVTAGIPKIPGKDMVEKKQYFIEHLDDVRKSVMFEPRGHQDMFGAFLFIQSVKVDAVTLLSMIVSAVVGALIGGRIVTKLPEKKIQVVMGFALLITAGLMFASKRGWLALLGANNTALHLTGIALVVGVVGNFIFGALMMAGVGLYAPCLAMVSLLGMDPKAAFPIMMGSCAALMAIGSPKFIKEGLYPRKGTIGLTIGGIIGVIVGYQFITSLSLNSLLWLIIVVVVITGFDMLRKGLKKAA